MDTSLIADPDAILSPDEYLWSVIVAYPSLYARPTMERAKLAVLDQLLNVTGNGIRDDAELIDALRRRPQVPSESDALRFIGKEMFYGYRSVRTIAGHLYPDSTDDSVAVLDEDRHLHPEVKLWVPCRQPGPDKPWVPYPNFDARYSAVSIPAFRGLGPAWRNTAIWFYEEARRFFEAHPENYHYAYPSNRPERDAGLIQSFEKAYPRYGSHEAFGEAYGVPFHGDFDDFARRRWAKERQRCLDFIDGTLTTLRGW